MAGRAGRWHSGRVSRKTDIERVAREQLQFDSLRPGQLEAVQSLLKGRDTLVVQPTGSGKSAIYRIAGLMLPGATVIVSPLIALQKDQVEAIQEAHNGAAAVNSAQNAARNRAVFEELREGQLEYLFLAPEQLRKSEIVDRLKSAGVSLFVVDEAHCVSEWGHDFRPDYLHLGAVIEALGHPTVLALTATAAPDVRREITGRLGMRQAKVLVRGLDRPNIFLAVEHVREEPEKLDALLHRIRWADKPGIVYSSTRRNTEAIMRALEEESTAAAYYHAGLRAKERDRIQEQFMNGEVQVIVATCAFGMGIDKENVRFVYHFDISESLDTYYQEIGRAGRDGEPAEAVLFYRHQDLGIHKFQAGLALEAEKIEQVAEALGDEGPLDAAALVEKTELSERKVVSALQRLEDAGAVETLPDGAAALKEVDVPAAVMAASREHEAYQDHKTERIVRGDVRLPAPVSAAVFRRGSAAAVPELRQLPQVARRHRGRYGGGHAARSRRVGQNTAGARSATLASMNSATPEHANLILRLYEARREPRLREARQWFGAHYKQVVHWDDHVLLCPPASEQDASFRMVTSYWEMAASFVNCGALDAELFYRSSLELLFVWERVRDVLPAIRQVRKNPLFWEDFEKVATGMIAWMQARAPESYAAFSARVRA